MTAATATAPTNGRATVEAPPTRNAHQRKLAVMKRCEVVTPDKTHPAHHYPYNSIQNVSNHLRRFFVEEGLDYVPSVVDGSVIVELVNVDDPSDKIVSTWPVVDGDKGFAYSVKYPLVRLFLIGDGEENDESTMADNAARSTRPAQAPAAKQAAAPAPTQPRATQAVQGGNVTYPAGAVPELGRCQMCGGFFFAKVSKKNGSTYYQCRGRKDNGDYCNTFAERDAVAQYEAGRSDLPNIDDDTEIPY